jgi:protein TonB
MDGLVTTLVLQRERIGVPQTIKPGLRPALLLATAAIHAALIAAGCLLVVERPTPPPADPGIQIVYTQAAAPPQASVTTLDTETLQLKALPVIANLAPISPITIQGAPQPRPGAARVTPHHHPTPLRQPSATEPDTETQASPPAPPTAHPLPPAATQQAARASLANWEARIRQAVQDAALYPASARLQHRQGRAQVHFAYANAAISAVAVVASSGSAALDAAALAAVTGARMPAPPPDLGPQNRIMLVWVQFTLAED